MGTSLALILEVKQRTTGLEAGVKSVETAAQRMRNAMGGVEKTSNKMSTSLSTAFKGFIGITAAITALKSINDATVKFSAAMADLSAITGATGKDLEYLKSAAQDLGTTTLSNATDVAEAFKLVGSVKADLLDNVEALKQTTEQVILLSTASGVDLATAAKTTGSAMNQFGLESAEAARVVNVLAAGSKFGAAEVDSLGEALKYVGPVASSLGLSIEETVAAIELLAQAGIQGSEAGTGLRQVLLRLAKDTDSSINPTVVGLAKALENLKARNMDAGEATEKFGLNAVSSGLALVNFSGQMESMTKKLTGTNTAMEQASVIADSYAGKIKKLSNAFEGLKIAAGESGAGGGLVKMATNDISALSKGIREYGLVLGTIKGGLVDPVAWRAQAASNFLTPDTGDAGITSTTPMSAKAKTALGDNLLKKWGEDVTKVMSPDTMEKSFIAPIISAGTEVRIFKESIQEATKRLDNAFQRAGFDNPAKSVANTLINGMAEQAKKPYEAAGADLKDSAFIQQTQLAAELVNQIKGARGNKRIELENQLNSQLEDLNKQAFSPSAGNMAVGTAGGGTFSVTGNSGGLEQQKIKQEIVGEFNKYVSQQLDKKQQVEVTITINPNNKAELEKYFKIDIDKKVKETLGNSAKSIAN